jgi:trimeric autotransporter adhesin
VHADLVFEKSGNDLVLKVGATDQITFTGYYTSTANRSVDRLQVVIEGTAEYVPGGGDVTRDNKVELFNFEGLVAAFDAARVANPLLTSWALTNGLAAQYLSGSDTAAIGGDLAYRYNRFGSLADVSFNPALAILGDANFATATQTLQALGSLQDATPRLG